jgi:CheY-like chemotaxis protein
MRLTLEGEVEVVEYLLQDACVRALINLQDSPRGNTALHFACVVLDEAKAIALVRLLLQAGANPLVANRDGEQSLEKLRKCHPSFHTAIALLERAIANAEKTSLLVKARRLVIISRNTIAPSYLQGRVAQALPLPRVGLVPEADEEGHKFRTMMAFFLGIGGGPEGHGMPRDVFRVVLDMLMPSWDPLHYKSTETEKTRLKASSACW